MKRHKSLVDLANYPTALELARKLYLEEGHLRQSKECREIGDFIGMSSVGVWHAYLRGDLGVPTPDTNRANAWAKREPFYLGPDKPCRRCGGHRRRPVDGYCFDCEKKWREANKVSVP